MPRLSPRLLHRAGNIDPLLPLILRGTRDIASAKNELRWLKEFVAEKHEDGIQRFNLHDLCVRRARGTPLQYLMGTEYFGDLEILCEPGVLIPRQETAASVTHLARRLQKDRKSLPEKLRVLDLCTGTGCIPLLFHHEFAQRHGKKVGVEAVGIDISPLAIRLASKNRNRLVKEEGFPLDHQHNSLNFFQADVLRKKSTISVEEVPPLDTALGSYDHIQQDMDTTSRWDVLISNPPYISPDAFKHTTAHSVKKFEPKLALVPEESSEDTNVDPGDVFYPRLLEIAKEFDSQIVLFEVADLEQASRVAGMAEQQGIWSGIEIWRDDPTSQGHEDDSREKWPSSIRVIGSGKGRSVFAWRGMANSWLGLD